MSMDDTITVVFIKDIPQIQAKAGEVREVVINYANNLLFPRELAVKMRSYIHGKKGHKEGCLCVVCRKTRVKMAREPEPVEEIIAARLTIKEPELEKLVIEEVLLSQLQPGEVFWFNKKLYRREHTLQSGRILAQTLYKVHYAGLIPEERRELEASTPVITEVTMNKLKGLGIKLEGGG